MKSRIEFVQQEMKKRNLYSGVVDGLLNNDTIKAFDQAVKLYSSIKPEWPTMRKVNGYIQVVCLEANLKPGDIDGYWGPNTDYAYNQYLYILANGQPQEPWRPEEITDINPNNWPRQYTPEFDAFYGAKGQNLVKVQLPYPMRFSWDTTVSINSFSCHAKVRDSMQRVLKHVLDYYGIVEIKRLKLDLWGGCFNDRPIRGGTKPSMHSWGIAVDFNPTHNKLEWGRDKATFASPEYTKWWQFWEEEGWVSLGRQRNFDWMHVQAAKI
jgi:hypothetical protein